VLTLKKKKRIGYLFSCGPYNISAVENPSCILSDTSIKRPVSGILIDFFAFCGYTHFHNHGFGGSKKSYRDDTKASDEKQFRSSAETAILIIFLRWFFYILEFM